MFSLPLILRVTLLAASFAGLYAATRARLGLDIHVAPFTVCCGIISALMLGGMLGVLRATLWGLYLLGFAGLLYAYILKRVAPPPH